VADATAASAAASSAHSRQASLDAASSSTALYRQRLSVLQDRAKLATGAPVSHVGMAAPVAAPAAAALPFAVASSAVPAPSTTPVPATSLTSIDAIRARFKSARISDENSTPAVAAPAPNGAAAPASSSAAGGLSAAPVSQPVPVAAPAVSSIDAIKARIAALNKNAAAATAPAAHTQ